MDNVVEKKLSELSRGFGTSSGKLIRDTPLFSCTESLSDFELRKRNNSDSNDDLFLLRIDGNNESSIERLRDYENQKVPHKTYSTRGGNLILFAESFYNAKRRKKKQRKNAEKNQFDDVIFNGTCEDLAESILRFGNGNFHFLKDGRHNLRDERVISVRPGYSPMRYVASASKLWDPGWVEKLLTEKAIKEANLEKYRKIQLPKIDVIPSSDYDPLLRERPKPYSRVSLPDLCYKKTDGALGGNDEEDELIGDNASSGYAKSFVSEGHSHERKKLRRKKTMQMNKLRLEMPKESLPKIENYDYDDDDVNESESEWNMQRETSRNVIDRTFDNLRENVKKNSSSRDKAGSDIRDDRAKGDIVDKEQSGDLKMESSRSSSVASLFHKSFDYAALQPDQKEDLISQLLLQGIAKEATDVDSLISNETNENINVNKNKIDLTDRVSLPTIQGTSLPDSQSSKGFKGNALHRGLPSANSSKSKSSKDGSIKTNSTGLVISSITKLPPIRSEPATPNVSRQDEVPGDFQQVKLPPIYRKSLGVTKSNRSLNESEEDLGDLFVGGRAIDVNDVDIVVYDNKESEQSLPDVGQDLMQITEQGNKKIDDADRKAEMQENINAQDNLTTRESKPGHQSPDSGRSTGTGLTSLSDAKIGQHEYVLNKEPMTPVVEESSRASIASKGLSREGTLNRTSESLKQKSFISEKSTSLKGSSLAEQVEDSLLLIKGLGPDAVVGVTNEDQDVFSQGLKLDSRESKDSRGQINDYTSSAEAGETLVDEGVIVDEENLKNQENKSDEKEDSLLLGRTYTDMKTITESLDITLDDNDNHDDQSESDQRSSEGSFISSGLLHAQARAAAHSALSRPKSGIDLIEDMKIASVAFGQLFEGNIRQEATRSAKSRRNRAGSELISITRSLDSKDANRKRSVSALSMMAAKRMNTVDIDKLKANVTSLESLIDKKLNQSSHGQLAKQEDDQEKDHSVGDNLGSDKSFPAASIKSDGLSDKDIRMDIIGYGSVEKSSTVEEIVVRKEEEALNNQNGPNVVEKESETDEEQFRLALNAIVDEVKDLKEKKAPKQKKGRKVRISEDKFNIVRDRTSASPPFYAGKPKESKAPKGLSRVAEKNKKQTDGDARKNQKVVGQKGKKNAGKKEGKVTSVKKKPGKSKAKGDEDKILNEGDKVKDDRETANGKDNNANDLDKYDVPITIKTAVEKPVVRSDAGLDSKANAEESPDGKVGETKGLEHRDSELRRDLTMTETETDGSVILSVNEDSSDDRVAAARAKGRQLAAEKRRLKVEQKRKEREEAKKRALAEAERAEKLRLQEELDMQKRVEEYKKQKELEDRERSKREEEEQAKLRRLEFERDKEKREREEQKRKKAAMAARLKIEEDLRKERERIARQIEEEMRRQEEEKLKQMEEHERLEYEKQKKLEEEERLRQEEERQRLERERRLIEEEELRIKMQRLEEFHRMLLERAKFWEGMKNSKWFLELNQRLTRAFTFSYFDLLPAMLFRFTDLRPYTPKESSSKKLPPIPEEK